jgi:RNA polymerase sigma-70 factor (ECF subfamily)
MPERDRRSPLPADARTLAAVDIRLTQALQHCAAGDLAAFHQLYSLAAPRLLGTLVQRLGDRDTAELVLQDCMVRIWRQARAFNPLQTGPDAWLQRFLPQQAIDAEGAGQPPAQEGLPVRPEEATLEKILARIETARPRRGGVNPRRWALLAMLVLGLALLLVFLARR